MAGDLTSQIEELKEIYGAVLSAKEGGNTFYLLKNVPLPPSCTPASCDVLLCADARDGYTSRLFFSERVRSHEERNWNGGVNLLGCTWHAFSWQLPEQGLTLAQKVSTHMRALE